MQTLEPLLYVAIAIGALGILHFLFFGVWLTYLLWRAKVPILTAHDKFSWKTLGCWAICFDVLAFFAPFRTAHPEVVWLGLGFTLLALWVAYRRGFALLNEAERIVDSYRPKGS